MDDMTSLFPQRRDALLAVAAVLVLLLLVGRLLVHAGTPSGTAVQPIRPLAKPAAPSVVVVDVVGAVRRPGLYRLREGAGSPTRSRGPAARPSRRSSRRSTSRRRSSTVSRSWFRGAALPTAAGDVGAAAAAGPVHLSTATAEQLDALPGVGPVTAQKILDYRSQHGAFHSVEELDAIPGIGPARLEQLRGLVAP